MCRACSEAASCGLRLRRGRSLTLDPIKDTLRQPPAETLGLVLLLLPPRLDSLLPQPPALRKALTLKEAIGSGEDVFRAWRILFSYILVLCAFDA